MSLIEQAAKRLAQLQRAGAEMRDTTTATETEGAAEIRRERVPTPEAIMRELNALRAESGLLSPSRVADAQSAMHARTDSQSGAPRAKVEIDLARLRARGFVTPEAPQSQLANEFRVLKRPIIRNALGRSGTPIRNGTLVMVTSALPGEGKTFTAANLALSMAMELDNTVLLVDADTAQPSLPDVLGIPPSPGLLDVLVRDDLDLSEVLMQTNLEKLTVLPAGSNHRHATELLASEKMTRLLDELTTRYPDRIVIFDSPPLLATAEAPALATKMGQIVMVVAADRTSRKTVSLALAAIERCEIVLMTLNKAAKSEVGRYYGYYPDDDPR